MAEKKAPIKRRKLKEKEAPKEVATSFPLTQLYYEIDTVKLQMEMFSDEDLYDYCLPHIEMYRHRDLDKLYPKVAQGKKLDKEERRALEAFCILANTELFLIV